MNRRKSPNKSLQSSNTGLFRIIGGQWRSRKLTFTAYDGLRPTPDRIRETLFNWLLNDIQQAHCLDLFAGSGALGIEALSRGADYCLFIDNKPTATDTINDHLNLLSSTKGQAINGNLPTMLSTISKEVAPFHIVFLDPPYALKTLEQCLSSLIDHRLLADNAWIYIENSAVDALPPLPNSMSIYRHKTAGKVQYALLRYERAKHDV